MMKLNRIRRLTAALLIIVLLVTAAPVALAASFSAYVKSSSMKVYSDAALTDAIGSLSKYTVVTVKDYANGVAKISYNGKTGFAKVSAMEKVSAVAEEAVFAVSGKVYKSASTSSASTTVSAGTKVNVITVNGKWALIERSGVGGYTYESNLSYGNQVTPIATPTPAPTAKPTATPEPVDAVVNAGTKVYQKADKNSKAIAVPAGLKVEILAVNGDWAYIRNTSNGALAYIQTKYLSDPDDYVAPTAVPTEAPTEKPTEKPTEAPTATPAPVPAVINANTRAYKKASTSAAFWNVKAGLAVEIIAVNGDWAYIRNTSNGALAYIQTKYLSDPDDYNAPTATPTAEPTEAPTATPAPVPAVINTTTRAYKKASTSSAFWNVKAGLAVEIIAVNGDWAYIRNTSNGALAYIQTKYLSDPDDYNAPTATPTAEPTEAPTATPAPVPAVINTTTRAYKKASTSSAFWNVKAGLAVEIIAVNGDWAYIRNTSNGALAYIQTKYLSDPDDYTAPTATPTVEPTAEPTATPAPKDALINTDTKVYQKASTSSKYWVVKAGMKVQIIATSGDWAYIKNVSNGAYAYVQLKYLTNADEYVEPTATPTVAPTMEPKDAIINADTKVYQKASTSSKYWKVTAGMQVQVIAESGDWAYIKNLSNGALAYIQTKYLVAPEDFVTPSPTPMPKIEAMVLEDTKVYKKPSTSSSSAKVSQGTRVSVIEISGDWAYICSESGTYAYIQTKYLTTTESEFYDIYLLDEPIEAIVVSSQVGLFTQPGFWGNSVGTLKQGTEVQIVATIEDGSWVKVIAGSKSGWCELESLGQVVEDPLEGFIKETFTATVVTTDAKFYDTEGNSKAVPFGTDVTVGAYSDEYAYVQYGDKVGFIPVKALSRTTYAELKKGDSGDKVSTLEKALLAGGYFDAVPDSNYDAATATAVQRFQSACGLTADGVASEGLQRMLYSGNGPSDSILSTTMSRGDSGANVTRIQNRLYALGYLSKTTSIDGDFGNTTAAAITLFQNANGVSTSSKADTATLRKLYSTAAVKLPSGKTPADVATAGGVVSEGSQKNHGTTISTSLASTTSSYSSGMSNAAKLEYAIYVGQNQLGKPYIYATSGPNSYDCTGFTCYCMKQIGISLPRTAMNQGQNEKYERIKDISALKRGDLVFFNTVNDSDPTDHAGIYLGSGWFIHASSGQAKVVISTLSSGYYNRVFSWGHRVLE